MWHSRMLVTRLQEDGFHAVAVDDFRPASVAVPSPQPMSTIYVPEREAQDAQRRLEELRLP